MLNYLPIGRSRYVSIAILFSFIPMLMSSIGISSADSSSTGLDNYLKSYYTGWTYILALGIIVAFIDGFGIGANDVANSFATSVGSGSLTLFQAVCIGLVTETTGALLLGKNTSETIRGKIVAVELFDPVPGLLSLGMFCALLGSASFVLMATRYGLPVSTTHSIVGSIMGVGIASFGVSGVDWSFSGFGGIVASWFISPILAGILAIIIWKFTEYMVLKQENSFEVALKYIPFYFFVTVSFIVFFLVYKGITRIDISAVIGTGGAVGVSLGFAIVAAILSWYFYVPYIRRYADKIYISQQQEENNNSVELEGTTGGGVFLPLSDETKNTNQHSNSNNNHLNDKLIGMSSRDSDVDFKSTSNYSDQSIDKKKEFSNKSSSSDDIEGWSDMNYYEKARTLLFRGVNIDVVHHSELSDMHARVVKYDNKTEIVYSTLQVLTAAFASFAHGSNDISNAVGPLSTIFAVYNSDYQFGVRANTDTPIWIVLICTVGLDIGLFTYGYNIMRELGNKITYHSPARGFSMELAAGFAVLFASKMGWPISTTHCITGATLAVGLSSGDVNAVNWRRSIMYMLAWMITVPLAGTVAGVLFSLMAFSPKAYNCIPNQICTGL